MKRLLVIDDEPGHRMMIRAVLEDEGWQVFEAASGEEGLDFFIREGRTIHVALVDMNMPGIDGHTTLMRLHEITPSLPVILLTAYGTVGTAVEAMKRGAFDYLTKPADNDELTLTLNRAWEYNRLQEENDRLRCELSGEDALKALVGTSAPMRQVHTFIRQAGPSEATVLVTGESGTGKELVAEALHNASSRSKKPLIKVNCAALPAQLLESELFGYERGAFTGAVRDKPGRFQLAAGGTLFLDEIGEIPLDLQAKLLRAIQERVIEPLGSVRSRPVDVRILAATNRDLRNAVAHGSFREDLFFRLNVLEIESPPLRTRLEDLPLLVNHLLRVLSEKNRKEVRGVSPDFLEKLSQYHWPGNVRELENILERALVLSRADILECSALPPQVIHPSVPSVPRHTYSEGSGISPSAPAWHDAGGLSASYPSGRYSPAPPHYPAHHVGQTSAPFPADNAPQNHFAAGGSPFTSQGYPAYGEASPTAHAQGSGASCEPSPTLFEEAERNALLQALHMYNGHREKTADALGISRRTLQYKIKKFGLNRRG